MYVKIKPYYKGLVFRKGRYIRMLNEGFHWLRMGEVVMSYDTNLPFNPPISLNILLQDEELKQALHIVEVKDNEIALRYDNGLYRQILTAGRYAFWKDIVDYTFVVADTTQLEASVLTDKSILAKSEVLQYIRIYTVEPHEKALLYVDGKLERVLEAGTYHFWKNQSVISVQKADLRQQQIEINGQEILTKDKAALRLNFFARYVVTDIMKALRDNKEYDKQLYIMLQLALREYIGGYSLDELLEKRNDIADAIIAVVKDKVVGLGVEVSACGIRDIILPGDMKEIMNQVLIAEKKAQANTIMRREETASTRSLLNTAKMMEENLMLFKLKEMEYVEKIADKISNISLSGGSDIVGQLKQIFVPAK